MKTIDIIFGVIITIAIFGVLGYAGYAFYQITCEVLGQVLVPPEPFIP